MVDLDRREARETRVNWVHLAQLVSRVWLELPVQLAAMVNRGQEDSRACLARKEMKDPEDFQGCQDPSDCRACPALLVRRERMEMSDQWVHQVLQVPEVHRAPAELMVHKVPLVALVQWEVLVRREKLVRLVTQDHQENLAFKALEVRLVRREKLAHPVLLDPLVAEDPPEMTVPRETLDLLASRETQDPLESLVLGVLMVYLEIKVMMESLDNRVLQAHLVKLEYQGLLAKGDQLDVQVRREDREKRDLREKLEQRDLLGKPDQWDPRVPLENLVLRVYVEFLGL